MSEACNTYHERKHKLINASVVVRQQERTKQLLEVIERARLRHVTVDQLYGALAVLFWELDLTYPEVQGLIEYFWCEKLRLAAKQFEALRGNYTVSAYAAAKEHTVNDQK